MDYQIDNWLIAHRATPGHRTVAHVGAHAVCVFHPSPDRKGQRLAAIPSWLRRDTNTGKRPPTVPAGDPELPGGSGSLREMILAAVAMSLAGGADRKAIAELFAEITAALPKWPAIRAPSRRLIHSMPQLVSFSPGHRVGVPRRLRNAARAAHLGPRRFVRDTRAKIRRVQTRIRRARVAGAPWRGSSGGRQGPSRFTGARDRLGDGGGAPAGVQPVRARP